MVNVPLGEIAVPPLESDIVPLEQEEDQTDSRETRSEPLLNYVNRSFDGGDLQFPVTFSLSSAFDDSRSFTFSSNSKV